MKTKPAAPEKKPKEPRLVCAQTNYSAGALKLMEEATGQRFTPYPTPAKPAVRPEE